MTSMHSLGKRFIRIAAVCLAAIVLHSSPLLAQEEQAVFVQGDKKYDVTISLGQIGIVLTEEALTQKDKSISDVNQMGLKLPDKIDDGPIVATTSGKTGRKELADFSRSLNLQRKDLVKAAGFIMRYRDFDAFEIVTDQFVVKFNDGVSSSQINDLHSRHRVEVLSASPYLPNLQLVQITPESGSDALTVSNEYNDEPIVEYAHPNSLELPAARQGVVMDPLLPMQWHLNNLGLNGGALDADIDADRAWAIQRGDPSIKIAIIDNGFDYLHPDLVDNLWTNPGEIAGDRQDNDGNGYVDDVHGWNFSNCPVIGSVGCGDNDPTWSAASTWGPPHGTLSAGGAVARGDNGRGMSGSCPNCKFIPIRLGNNSYNNHLALAYANLVGAAIISNSWGCDAPCKLIVETTIDQLATTGRGGLGTVIFFAMDNRHINRCVAAAQPDYSSRETVIAVSAVDHQDKILTGLGTVSSPGAAFGNCMDVLSPTWGPTRWAATTDLAGSNGYNNSDLKSLCAEGSDLDYTFCATGTSFATPVAAGVAGLILSSNPSLSRVQVQRLLQDTADKVEPSAAAYSGVTGFSMPTSGHSTHGYGRINSYEAVRIASAGAPAGGSSGVDIFVRDNQLDWGNTEQLSSLAFDTTRGFIPHWDSADIKIDAPPYQPQPTSSSLFDAIADENPISGEINRVYVRVRNRGLDTAAEVTVKVHWAYAGLGLPALPSDFWTMFPLDSSDTSVWNPLGAQTISELRYSGASVAGSGADAARVLVFEFAAPEFDSSLPNPSHYCLLAIIDSPQDSISSQAISSTIVDNITPRYNNVTQKNIVLVPPSETGLLKLRLSLTNPFAGPIRTMLRLRAPRGFSIESSEIPFDTSEVMKPGSQQFNLVLRMATLEAGQSIDIYQLVMDGGGDQQSIFGGLTIKPGQ